ncbi:MAG: transposase [Methanomicrobiales archaeon]|nr:transposase [Methanomicrobiales archaeon]
MLKEVPKGYTIIMDNASFHRKAKLRELVAKVGVEILFLPTYSPDLNPIEKSWANMKRWLRDNISPCLSIDMFVPLLMNVIPQYFRLRPFKTEDMS